MKKLLNGQLITGVLLAIAFSLSLTLTSCGGQGSQEATDQEEATEEKQTDQATGDEEHPKGEEEHPTGNEEHSDSGEEHPNSDSGDEHPN